MDWEWSTVTDPLRDMLSAVFEYIPRILGALAILIVAWIAALILRKVVKWALKSANADERVSSWFGRKKEEEPYKVVNTSGQVVYWLVLLFGVVAALVALGLPGVDRFLDVTFGALPGIFAAILLIAVAFFFGRLVANLVASFLKSVGFDGILVRLGMAKEVPEGMWTPSNLVGYLVLGIILLLAAVAAADLLNFESVSGLLSSLTAIAGRVILAVVIFVVGLFLAGLVSNMIGARKGAHSNLMAMIVRIFIIVFATAIAIRETGFANELVTLTFGLLIGAIAVALALAFGLGGRESAARQLEDWRESIKSQESKSDET